MASVGQGTIMFKNPMENNPQKVTDRVAALAWEWGRSVQATGFSPW